MKEDPFPMRLSGSKEEALLVRKALKKKSLHPKEEMSAERKENIGKALIQWRRTKAYEKTTKI